MRQLGEQQEKEPLIISLMKKIKDSGRPLRIDLSNWQLYGADTPGTWKGISGDVVEFSKQYAFSAFPPRKFNYELKISRRDGSGTQRFFIPENDLGSYTLRRDEDGGFTLTKRARPAQPATGG